MSPMLFVVICLVAVALAVRPLGEYLARIMSGKPVRLSRLLGPVERGVYRICGIDAGAQMNSRHYALCVLIFGVFGFVLLFAILLFQHRLPLNPQQLPGLSFDLAFNIAASFLTNTNWQSYGGESTLSYFSQMVGLAVQNFLSAATGIAVACALFRAFRRKQENALGNFWVDVTRATLYVLLPLAFFFSLFLVSQGVVQNFSGYSTFQSLQSGEAGLIAQGPAGSQVAIKMLGSNGGGFFNANGAHPFENPTPLSNYLQIITILLLPAAIAYAFGVMAGDRRQGWMLVAAMSVLFLPFLWLTLASEMHAAPWLAEISGGAVNGNWEGKEIRHGLESSALWAVATTATSNGSVNAMHGSFTPLGALGPLLLMQLGEVVFGGVGSGVYGMLVFVLLTVFIGGLMVGRTPEFMGKKIGIFEIKMVSLIILVPATLVLVGTALAVSFEMGRAGIASPGPHGFSEALYAFSSAANNNGSAMGGISVNTPFYNLFLGVVMLLGRYGVILPILAMAGTLAAKNSVPPSAGTLPTHTPLFVAMLVGIVLLIGVLTYIPALALGPIAEHLELFGGRV